MGEGRHVRFTVASGAGRAGGVAFGRARLPDGHADGLDAAFSLEVNRWQGREEARLVLRSAAAPAPAPITGPPEGLARVLGELDAPLPAPGPQSPASLAPGPGMRDVRGTGLAGTIAALVASGDPVLVLVACTERRRRALEPRLGGFALCSWTDLERDPQWARGVEHLVALDPPACAAERTALAAVQPGRTTHLAWGTAELDFTHDVLEHDAVTRPALTALYRSLRDAPSPVALEHVLDGRSAVHAGRLLRVLAELEVVDVDRSGSVVRVLEAPRTELADSTAFRAFAQRTEEARRWLTRRDARAA
jgi:single-stranded-DNA-specific exonuclease